MSRVSDELDALLLELQSLDLVAVCSLKSEGVRATLSHVLVRRLRRDFRTVGMSRESDEAVCSWKSEGVSANLGLLLVGPRILLSFAYSQTSPLVIHGWQEGRSPPHFRANEKR